MTDPAFTHPLRLIPTPIGNLGDVSRRVVEELSSVTMLCCEDTRRTSALLTHLGIDRPRLVVVDEHRERSAVPGVLAAMEAGERVGLVSDAGTPSISDPGWLVVRAVIDAGGTVEALPGPAAFVGALVVSGLPTSRFAFEGFLPRSGASRTRRLRDIAAATVTTVLYEAPHRVARTLADLESHCGSDRQVTVARELTKMHEEVWRGSLADAVAWVADRTPRGEFVLVLAGAPPTEVSDDDIIDAMGAELAGGVSRRDAAGAVAERLGVRRSRAYDLSLQME